MVSDRYSRQTKLKEIGIAGQFKLSCATVTIPAAGEFEIAAEYLTRSGIQQVVANGEQVIPNFQHQSHFQFDTCRTFAFGAWFALREIVKTLDA